MKNSVQVKSSSINTNLGKYKELLIDKTKTTNINILLNRVKLNERDDLKKKIHFLISVIFGY